MKRRGFIPSGSGLDTSDILQILTEQLRNYIPAFLKGLREEFIIKQLSVTVTSGTVPIPVRACGVALRTIGWTCADGTVRPLTRIEPERRQDWPASGGEPQGYMFQGNNVILFPPASAGTLVVSYQQRPGELVATTDVGAITAIDAGTRTLTFDSLPSTFTDAKVYDIVSSAPNFDLLGLDVSVDAATATTLQLTEAIPAGVFEGNYVCLATETCVPQLPLECFDLLAQAAAVEIAQSTGSSRLQALKDGLKDLREQVAMILSPRSDGSARVIVNRSGIGRRWW